MSLKYYSGKTKKAIQILTDLAALLVSYFLSIALRYYILNPLYSNRAIPSYQLYSAVLFMLILSYLLMAILRKGKGGRIEDRDGFDTVQNLLKDEAVLLMILFLFLFATKWTSEVSRSVIGFLVILYFAVDLPVRIKVRNVFRWSAKEDEKKEKTIVVAPAAVLERPEYIDAFHNMFGFDVVGTFAIENLDQNVPNGEYRSVLFCAESMGTETQKNLFIAFQNSGKLVYYLPEVAGELLPATNWLDIQNYKLKRFDDLSVRESVFGVPYAVTNLEDASFYVRNHVKELSGKYLCFSNVHTAVMAREDETVRKAEQDAAIVFPDGSPIRRKLRHKGHVHCERVAGPDFMRDVFEHTRDGQITHFFYGASQDTLDKLKANLERNYQGIIIKGMISPPYRSLTDEEQAEYIKQINDAKADIVWIGLGAPKQELWMQKYAPQIHGVLAGVGAGFDFHAGTIKRAPKWVQRMSLEWLYRLFQDPARLFKRYFVTNFKYIIYSMKDK